MLDFLPMAINNIPLLSIITVNYNNADGLKKTMQSVLDLEFKDYEYIIIDGGSSDKSVDIIKYYLENTELSNKITYWCSEKDDGIYNAMNKGLTHVNGKLVNLMNSGDCFISDSLNNLHAIVNKNPDTVLYGAVNQTKDGIYINTYAHNCDYSLEHGLCSQAVLIPAKFHEILGNYDEQYKICADFEFYQRINNARYGFKFINRVICDYDITGVSVTQDDKRKRELKLIKSNYGMQENISFKKKLLRLVKQILPYGVVVFCQKIKR